MSRIISKVEAAAKGKEVRCVGSEGKTLEFNRQ
jgi:hypothetical protein